MNRIILIILIFTYNITNVAACDFCNCYLGLNPQSKKNNLGLRYHYMQYTGTHMAKSELQELNLSEDDFWETRTSIELHGQFYPTQKLQLLFSAPYIINSEGMSSNATAAMNNSATPTHTHTHASETEPVHLHGASVNEGIGDPLLIANYQLFNKTGEDSTKFSQRLFAGGGIKMPLGNYQLEDGADPLERVHLPGTGSWDYLLSANYLGKINKTGFNINLTYLVTTENDESFEFGNRVNANATVYYQVDFKKNDGISLFPNVGAYYEQADRDLNEGVELNNSGGMIVYAHAGLDIYYKRLSINTAFQIPAMQSLNQPQPEVDFKIITGISYAFN